MTVRIEMKILEPSDEQFGCVSIGRPNESDHMTIISLRRGDTAVQIESTMIFSDRNTAIGPITSSSVSLILLNFSAFFITCAIRYVFVANAEKTKANPHAIHQGKAIHAASVGCSYVALLATVRGMILTAIVAQPTAIMYKKIGCDARMTCTLRLQ